MSPWSPIRYSSIRCYDIMYVLFTRTCGQDGHVRFLFGLPTKIMLQWWMMSIFCIVDADIFEKQNKNIYLPPYLSNSCSSRKHHAIGVFYFFGCPKDDIWVKQSRRRSGYGIVDKCVQCWCIWETAS